MVAATVLQSIFQFSEVATIGSAFGGIPPGLPPVVLPAISFDKTVMLLPAAFMIAMLGAIESLLSAVVADGMAGTRHDSNQELIGQGIANLIAPLFGGFAATGAIARTATNFRNGANSPLAGLAHCATLVLILLFLAPLAAQIPLCALAAVLFVVAWNMSEVRHFVRMARTAPSADVVILFITFGLTILVDLLVAVNIGVILALLQFLRRMAAAVEVVALDKAELATELAAEGWQQVPEDVLVFSIRWAVVFCRCGQSRTGAGSNPSRSARANHSTFAYPLHGHHRHQCAGGSDRELRTPQRTCGAMRCQSPRAAQAGARGSGPTWQYAQALFSHAQSCHDLVHGGRREWRDSRGESSSYAMT